MNGKQIVFDCLMEVHMNRKVKIYVCFSVLLLIVAVIPALVQAQILPLKLCCIAGNYEGTHKPNAEPNCPVPKSEVFYMTVKQGKGCAAAVWGTITDIAGAWCRISQARSLTAASGAAVF